MRAKECVSCAGFPCSDVRNECYAVPDIELEANKISVVLVSEAAPALAADRPFGGVMVLR